MSSGKITKERKKLLRRFENLFETPMIILGFLWLILLIIEFVSGLTRFLEISGLVIWGIFVVDFFVKFFIAPNKPRYLKTNLITMVSLVVPAFRVVRVFRVIRLLRVTRSFRLVRVLGSLNRGIRAVGATMQRRAFGYVVALTLLVFFVGSAGMFAFEKDHGLQSYGASLWWTAMLLTTMGSEYWPKTAEGRILCIVLAVYAFAMFGYVTATIATFFIGRDAENSSAEIAGAKQLEELKRDVSEIREMIRKLDS
jgi:voltage-gated potassium channel